MTVLGWTGSQGILVRELRLYGRGLHTGKRVNVRVHPERVGHDIVFRRMRGGQQLALLPASAVLRLGQPLCTALQNVDGWCVRTVERLPVTPLACQIDHAIVEIDAEEVPILDGSAQSWLQAIEACGRLLLDASKRFLQTLKTVTVEDGGMHRTIIKPADYYAMSVVNDLKGFGETNQQGIIDPISFVFDIVLSHSYGRLRWTVPAILFGYPQGQPVLHGVRPLCIVTIVGSGVIDGIHLPMEFVRHRVLDLIGDLALPGVPLLGKVIALRPSHEMNYRLYAVPLARPDVWERAYLIH